MSSLEKRVKTSKRSFIIALSLLLFTNITICVVFIVFYRNALREHFESHMLDLVCTASSQINGDELEKLTKDDVDTEEYQRALNTLRSYQDNINLDYIYGIKAEDDGTFTFTIDPAVDDPGEFGSPIVTTDALKEAANGTAAVDKTPYTDKWGTFYSAYSPVFNSKGEVAGIIAVDYSAEWFNEMINSNRRIAVILTAISLCIGIFASSRIMNSNKKHFSAIMDSISQLDLEMQKLDNYITKISNKKLDLLPDTATASLKTLASGEGEMAPIQSEYDELQKSIENLTKKLKKYLKFINSDVYNDNTTNTKNRAAYKLKVKQFSEDISRGSAKFAVGFVDINDLKDVSVNFGYEAGDRLLYECGRMLKNVFGYNNVYHVVGDEFIILCEGKTQYDMITAYKSLDENIENYHDVQDGVTLTVSKGYAVYDKEKYDNYRNVFLEAKADCDKNRPKKQEVVDTPVVNIKLTT